MVGGVYHIINQIKLLVGGMMKGGWGIGLGFFLFFFELV